MQAAIERRDPAAPRVPLDLWVRLNHEDFEDDFDADAVDLSPGGLSLRSDYLPEIGDRLRCRFDDPTGASEIEVDGEVVWAHDTGGRSGEFGLRFAPLPEPAEAGLRRLVDHLGAGNERQPIRLQLAGVGQPIEGDLVERSGRWLEVEQELRFLEIGTDIATDTGATGRLASVELRLEAGIPRLVLGVELDEGDAAEASEVSVAPDTLDHDDQITTDGEHGAREIDARGSAASEEIATYDEPELEAANDRTMQDVSLSEALRDAREDAEERGERLDSAAGREEQAVQAFDLDASADDVAPVTASEAARDGAPTRAQQILARLAPIGAAALAFVKVGASRLGPAFARVLARLRAFGILVRERSGPLGRTVGGRLAALARPFAARLKKSKPKRRTTAMPKAEKVAAAPKRQQRVHAEEAPATPRRNRRLLALGAIAFVLVAGTVYALSGGDEPAEPTPPAAAPPPVLAAPEPAPVLEPAPAPEPLADPEAGAVDPLAEEPAAELTPPTPEPAGGPLEEPSYPTLRDAVSPADGPVSEGLAFGADSVPDARSGTIRLSLPPTSIRGQELENGFTVTIPGALALDRAAPIASANPSVDRATIINNPGQSMAVLDVRFVAGRHPTYRVVARGRALEVAIGR
ncbi:MAG: PilZ domain-containing protein [Sandaracinaceae bacterium]